ncbi:MAG: FecR family protein [Spirochaetales bacterium]|jgi:hypothetical protein|nr:FecR family protein [Spirochaetales bacterium]
MKIVVLCCALLFAAAFAFGQTGVIKEITGTVELKAPGATSWKPASVGMVITKNTLISTGFRSTALVGLGNSLLTVQALTRLSLEEIALSQGNEKIGLALQTGRVRANVMPPSGGRTDFTVRSPTATASVRGTTFVFDANSVSVSGGLVTFAGANGLPVAVAAGESSAVMWRGTAAAPVGAETAPPSPVGASEGAITTLVTSTPIPSIPYGAVRAGFTW